MQWAVQTKNNKASDGICFSREDKAVTWLGPAAYWKYVRSPRRGTNAVFHRSCTFGAASTPENRFRNCFGRTNSKESSGICFSREGKAVAWLGPAAYWRYVRSPRRGTNAVCPPENKFRSGYWADVVSTTDYYPFGMGMVERGDDGRYRYGFNGQERDDEVAGAGNSYTAEFWQYDSRLGRRWNVDPVVKSYASNYSVFSNNPLTMVDPDGAADFYNEAGVKVGTDGNPDGIIYILTSEADIKKAMHSYYGKGIMGFFRQLFGTKGRGTIQRDAFNGDVYVLPPPVVRQAMLDAVDASNGPSGLDEDGGFHEEGGYWGLDKNGNMVVVPAKPGSWVDPSNEGARAQINVFDAVDKELAASVVTILGTYHVHPSGKLAIAVKANNETSNVTSIGFQGEPTSYNAFDQHPSRTDVKRAGERNLENNFVLGARNGSIYIYGSEGENTRQSRDISENSYNSHKATSPIERFKELTPE